MKKTKTAKKKLIAAIACMVTLAFCFSLLYVPGRVFAEESSKSNPLYTTDYNTMEEAQAAAEKLTAEIEAEGAALLKNENDALPLRGNSWISVFGVTEQGMEGNGASDNVDVTLSGALADSGFNVNPTLRNYYRANYATAGNNSSVGSGNSNIGKEDTDFNAQVRNSFISYNDAAVVVFSRTGAEGSDAKRVIEEEAGTNMLGEKDTDTHVALYGEEKAETPAPANAEEETSDITYYKHYLMLTESERALLKLVENNFDNVIVLLNTSNWIEVDELKHDPRVDAIMNIGRPGAGGLDGVAKLLNGSVSPSGTLVDEWYSDFTADPTWYNFGSNDQTGGVTGGAGSNTYLDADGKGGGTSEDSSQYISDEEGYHGVDYEEGMYNGYRYYETYYTDLYNYLSKDANKNLTWTMRGKTYTGTDIAQAWYDRYVAYPFGYGLNYTDFTFTQGGIFTDEACKTALTDTTKFASTKDTPAVIEKIYIPVTVKNTGKMTGKKTVQAYITYDSYSDTSLTEHAAVTLVGYAKTDLIAPGESQKVVVPINVQDMASWYSYQVQTDKTRGAYIFEAGDYTIRIMESSHFDMATNVKATDDAYDEVGFTVASTMALEQDDFSGGQLSALYTSGLNDNGDGYNKDSEVGDANYGNIRSDEMMADNTSGMTTLTRNSAITASKPSATKNTYTGEDKDKLVFATKNYSGVRSPINPLNNAVVNGFDLSFPKAPDVNALKFHNNVLNAISYWDNYNISSEQKGARDNTARYQEYFEIDDNKNYPWSQTSVPTGWSQSKGELKEAVVSGSNTNQILSKNEKGEYIAHMYVSSNNTLKLKDMVGVAYDDPQWDQFLNQLTYDELASLMVYNGWGSVSMSSIDKPATSAADSPTNYNSTHQWTSADIMAATWNPDLAYREGVIMGNLILLYGNTEWLGPGADMHRSPFSGRNNEYFSSDGFQGGTICAAVINGAKTKGIVCYLKHCFMNDQETDRGVHFAWCDEQGVREVYARCFQLGFQEGGSNAGMTGYARLGGWCNTSNYNLGVKMYQQEWGTNAPFTTDGWIGWDKKTSPDAMVRAGNQTILTTTSMEYLSGQTNPETGDTSTGGFYKAGEKLPDGTTAAKEGVYLSQRDADDNIVYGICYTQWYCVRGAAKSILYAEANSAAFENGYSNLEIQSMNLEANESASKTVSIAIDARLDQDSAVTYAVSGGSLPAGMTLNSNTGEISGTPTKAGTYRFTVDYLIDGWIVKSASHTIEVGYSIVTAEGSDDFSAAQVGEEFVVEFTSSVFTTDSFDSIKYSIDSGSLPKGMALAEDGTLEGTPEEAGIYTFTVKLTATKESSSGGKEKSGDKGKGGGSSTETATRTITMTVADEEGNAPDPDAGKITLESLQAQLDALKDGLATSADIEEIQAQLDALKNAPADVTSADLAKLQSQIDKLDLAKLQSQIDELKENKGSGCNGSLGGTAILIILAFAAVAIGAVITVKTLRNKKDD